MPLNPKASVGHNIAEMMHAGHPQDQAVAAALNVARKAKAGGGELRQVRHVEKTPMIHEGPIHSPVAGRTDHLPMNVKSGSYVIPADIISAMGEGNTMAGFKIARRMFSSSPYFQKGKDPYDSEGTPYDSGNPYGAKLATGGIAPVEIVAAGGEYVISPEDVTRLGKGDIDHGHEILDHFVTGYRKKTIDTLKKLPGPKRN